MDKKPEKAVEPKSSEAKTSDKTEELMHDFKGSSSPSSFFSMKLFVVLLIAILLGSGTGFVLAKGGGKSGSLIQKAGLPGGSNVEVGKIYGSDDTETFSDTTEGKLMEGGIEGEGAYHLERGSGKEQWAYLTSSTVDLSQFVGRKIRVWGKTEKALVAPWLMDAGRVEVLE